MICYITSLKNCITCLQLDSPSRTVRASASKTPVRVQKTTRETTVQVPICALVSFVMIFAVLFYLKHIRKENGPSKKPFICLTKGCLDHAKFLKRTINQSVPPCDDFHAFVCSNSELSEGDIGEAEENTMREWYLDYLALLNESSHHFNMTYKAASMLRVCLLRIPSDNIKGVGVMKHFMRQRGIAWPWRVSEVTHPLDVLLDLAINWVTPLWFRLRVRSSNATTRVYLKRTLALEVFSLILNVIPSRSEMDLFSKFSRLYNEPVVNSKDEIDNLFKINTNVISSLVNSNHSSSKVLASVKISDIEDLTPIISRDT